MRQEIKGGLASSQRLGIAHKFKPAIDCIAHHIGQIIQIQSRDMPRAILLTERTKGPRQWITAFFIVKCIQRSKAWPLWQETSASDAVAQGGVPTL